MPKSGLPQASFSQKNIRFGSTVVKMEKPNQSFADAEKGLNNLEKAAKEKVFIINEPTEQAC